MAVSVLDLVWHNIVNIIFLIIQMKPGPLDENYIVCIVKKVLKGLVYLHSIGIVHGEVKGIVDTIH